MCMNNKIYPIHIIIYDTLLYHHIDTGIARRAAALAGDNNNKTTNDESTAQICANFQHAQTCLTPTQHSHTKRSQCICGR